MALNWVRLSLLSLTFVGPSLAQAADLRYRWQAGQTQRFRVVSNDTVSLKVSGMGGMGDMDGDEGDGMAAMGGKAPMMKVNGQFDLIFDPKVGRLVSLKGTMDTETRMGGMGSMNHQSKVALTGL